MAYLIILSAFLFLTMLLFGWCCMYVLRLILGQQSRPMPDAEPQFNPIPSGGTGVEDYLDRMGGNRFTEGTTFDMPKRSGTPDPEEDVPETDPSEIAVM